MMEENTNPTVQDGVQDEQSQANDVAEWESAEREVFGEPEPQSDLKPENTPKPEEQSQDTTDTTTTETTTPQTTTDETTTAETTTDQTTTTETTAAETTQAPGSQLEEAAKRVAQRYSSQSVESMKSELKQQLMPEMPEWKASDGFVIKSARDLETVEDPQTPGKAFTPERAKQVFAEYQQGRQQIEREVEEKAAKIASVYQGLEDEATIAMAAYKDLFAENPELQKSVYNAYSKTLKVNEQGMVEEAPVGLLEFYHSILEPIRKARQAPPAAAPAAPAAAPTQSPVDTTQRNQDRSDIYKPTTSTLSKEEEEWAEAAREVLGVKK